MSTTRESALAALREWSAPGRRADLIAAAWLAGETNIRALAEAARVSRPTVYADLRQRGIDPQNRSEGPSMITHLEPLNIEGFTGITSQADAEWRAAMKRWCDAHPDIDPTGPESHTEGMRLVALMDTAARYADVRDRLAHEQVARAERDRLLHQVQTCWEALSDPSISSWHAAHHAYIVAVDEARIGIDMWRERAESALERPFFCSSDRDEAAYRQILAAGHPPLEAAQAELDQEPAATAERLAADLAQADAHRRQLAAETLRLTQ